MLTSLKVECFAFALLFRKLSRCNVSAVIVSQWCLAPPPMIERDEAENVHRCRISRNAEKERL